MVVACWSPKGGSGTTVVARPRRACSRGAMGWVRCWSTSGATPPSALGSPEPSGPGVADWLDVGDDVPADGLARIEHELLPGLAVVTRGTGAFTNVGRAEVLAAVLAADRRAVVIDCGRIGGPEGGSESEVGRVLASGATHSLLVVRPCYLALRRATAMSFRPSGVVVVNERGRALEPSDVEEILGVPVVAVVDHDVAIGRAVDAGLLGGRLPTALPAGPEESGVSAPSDLERDVRSLARAAAPLLPERPLAETVDRVRGSARGARSPRSAPRRSGRHRGDGQRRGLRCGSSARACSQRVRRRHRRGRCSSADRAGRRAARAATSTASSPIVDARLPDGSRVHAVVRPLAVDGPGLTIRRFGARRIPLGELVADQSPPLLRWAVDARANILVSGGHRRRQDHTAQRPRGGDPPGERVVTVEDAAELRPARRSRRTARSTTRQRRGHR